MPLAAAIAILIGTCTVTRDGVTHRTPCRVSSDTESVVAVPEGRRQLAPGMLDISIEIIMPGYGNVRNLTPGGINSASGEILRERNQVCWSSDDRRICLGRAIPARPRSSPTIPASVRGEWGEHDPDAYNAHVTFTADRVTDDDSRTWRVTGVVDSDGVLVIRGVPVQGDDGTEKGRWVVSTDPDGALLILGSPNALPRVAADADSRAVTPAGK